jgi:hypothetical protein
VRLIARHILRRHPGTRDLESARAGTGGGCTPTLVGLRTPGLSGWNWRPETGPPPFFVRSAGWRGLLDGDGPDRGWDEPVLWMAQA